MTSLFIFWVTKNLLEKLHETQFMEWELGLYRLEIIFPLNIEGIPTPPLAKLSAVSFCSLGTWEMKLSNPSLILWSHGLNELSTKSPNSREHSNQES